MRAGARPVEERAVEGRRRRVGGVRVHVVQPQEERLIGARRPQVSDPAVGDGAGTVRLRRQRRLLPGLAVALEAAGIAVLRGQVRVVHDGRRPVARLVEHAGQRGIEVEQDLVGLAVAVLRGPPPRHHHDEAAARLGPERERAIEDGAALPEGVDVRAGRPAVTVDAEVIGAQGVDRDQEDAQAIARPRGREARTRRRRTGVATTGQSAARPNRRERRRRRASGASCRRRLDGDAALVLARVLEMARDGRAARADPSDAPPTPRPARRAVRAAPPGRARARRRCRPADRGRRGAGSAAPGRR